jgi:hypothetical protein
VPAAAVIPALIAYIKVVAVKKLVVGSWSGRGGEGGGAGKTVPPVSLFLVTFAGPWDPRSAVLRGGEH